jgi:holo-[acyl-carrier protein] synthase
MRIGTDIVNIKRIEKSIEKFGDKFKERFLNPEEIKRAKKIESIAGLWAAKEAISKALGCGICADLTFHDIHIAKNSQGAPYFTLTASAQKTHNITDTSLSISHDSGFAIAVVILNQQS